MPVVDPARLSLLDPAAFEREFYRGKTLFRPMVRKVLAETWRVPDPVPLLRLLQQAMRPVWAVEYRLESPEYRLLAAALPDVLGGIDAPLCLHSPHQAHPAGNTIRLTWHSIGKQPQRWHYKAAALSHRLDFDREGYAGWSSLAGLEAHVLDAVDQPLADAFCAQALAKTLADGQSKYPQDGAVPMPVTGQGFVFVPLQLANDSVIAQKLFAEPYLDGMGRMIARLAASGQAVVVKRHPHCDHRAVTAFLDQLPKQGVSVSTASIHRLIPASRCVLTLNSGVGFEALLHQKPVLVAGRAEYRLAATEVAVPDDICAAVARAEAGWDGALVRRFLFYALHQHQIDLRDAVSLPRALLRALCHNYMELAPR